jgi:hypothetical protein
MGKWLGMKTALEETCSLEDYCGFAIYNLLCYAILDNAGSLIANDSQI